MRSVSLFALLGLAAALGAAEDGGQPFAFVKQGVGARPAAMGRANGAVSDDIYAVVANPALLATLRDLQLGSQWADLPTARVNQFLGFGRPIGGGDAGAYGLAYHRSALEAPIEKRRANTPDPESTFSESANIFSATYAGWLWPDKLAAGFSFKSLAQNIGEASGGGFGGDLGLFLRTWDWLDLGLAMQDIVGKFTWNTGYAESVPLVVRTSAALRFGEHWLFGSEVEKSQVQELKSKLGAEFWPLPGALALRAGWAYGQWSTGLGLRSAGFGWKNLFGLRADAGLDYALVADSLGTGALQHRFSLDMHFALAAEHEP